MMHTYVFGCPVFSADLLALGVARVDLLGEPGLVVILARPHLHPRRAALAHLRGTVELVGARVVAAP